MDADRLTPQLRRVVDAAGPLDERLLVLLFVRKAEPAPILAEMLEIERAEAMTSLGRLSQAGLVSHQRPEGEPIHWFATREGKAKGERLHRAISARFAAEPVQEPQVGAPTEQPAEDRPADPQQRVTTRRRVAIDQNEKTGFSWD